MMPYPTHIPQPQVKALSAHTLEALKDNLPPTDSKYQRTFQPPRALALGLIDPTYEGCLTCGGVDDCYCD